MNKNLNHAFRAQSVNLRDYGSFSWETVLGRLAAIPFLIILFFVAHVEAATTHLSVDEVRHLQLIHDPDLIVVDVRSPEAYTKGHIQKARNAMASEMGSESLPKAAHIVLYCAEPSCSLASSAAEQLITLGYPNVSIVDGGFAAWLKHHYPAETGIRTQRSRDEPGMSSVDDAHKKILSNLVLVVDVRPSVEFYAGHIPGAHNIPLETMGSTIANLSKEKEILVYDRQSSRSRQAKQKLFQAGYRVSELAGGLAVWVKRKYPLETTR